MLSKENGRKEHDGTTFPHELGHVLHVAHNTQTLNSDWSTNTGTNFGYAKWEEEPKFRTLMSYKSWRVRCNAANATCFFIILCMLACFLLFPRINDSWCFVCLRCAVRADNQVDGTFYNCLGCRYQIPAFSSPALYHIRNSAEAAAAGQFTLRIVKRRMHWSIANLPTNTSAQTHTHTITHPHPHPQQHYTRACKYTRTHCTHARITPTTPLVAALRTWTIICIPTGHSDLIDQICLMPDSSNFDTTCDNDNYDNSNTGPAFNPPADADQFVLQCRDPANSSHTGVTQTKTVSYGDLVAMGYPLGASNRQRPVFGD